MSELTKITIDFKTSHLIFPTIIIINIVVLGLIILFRDRSSILNFSAHWRRGKGKDILSGMDKQRFLGTIILILINFFIMVPLGDIWPNTGMGFLLSSIPFVALCGILYMHERTLKNIITMFAISLVASVLVWWLFSEVFFLTLP